MLLLARFIDQSLHFDEPGVPKILGVPVAPPVPPPKILPPLVPAAWPEEPVLLPKRLIFDDGS